MISEIKAAGLEAMGPWALEWFDERAGIREYSGGQDREAAEAGAWREILAEEKRRKAS